MNWLRENFFWIVVGILFIRMQTKMHGGHGGSCGGDTTEDQNETRE